MEIELKVQNTYCRKLQMISGKTNFFLLRKKRGQEKKPHFNARYFDTPDFDLAKNDMAYRVRKEGCRWVAALKWKGHSEGALHMREEINVPVNDDKAAPEVFGESEIGAELMRVIGEKPLYSMLETRFHRRRFRIDTVLHDPNCPSMRAS